jgi:hypothetical protein
MKIERHEQLAVIEAAVFLIGAMFFTVAIFVYEMWPFYIGLIFAVSGAGMWVSCALVNKKKLSSAPYRHKAAGPQTSVPQPAVRSQPNISQSNSVQAETENIKNNTLSAAKSESVQNQTARMPLIAINPRPNVPQSGAVPVKPPSPYLFPPAVPSK